MFGCVRRPAVVRVLLPSPLASLFHAVNAFRVTWSERVFLQAVRLRYVTEMTAEAWEHAVQGLEKNALSFLFLIYVNTCSRICSMSYNVMSTFFAAPVGSKMV